MASLSIQQLNLRRERERGKEESSRVYPIWTGRHWLYKCSVRRTMSHCPDYCCTAISSTVCQGCGKTHHNGHLSHNDAVQVEEDICLLIIMYCTAEREKATNCCILECEWKEMVIWMGHSREESIECCPPIWLPLQWIYVPSCSDTYTAVSFGAWITFNSSVHHRHSSLKLGMTRLPHYLTAVSVCYCS